MVVWYKRVRRGSAKYGTGPVPGGSGGPGDPPDPPVDPEFTILSGGNPGQLYVLAYAYDLNGRRISLSYPSLLRPYSRAAAEYLYTDWGALEAIRGLAGEWYSFGYDEESRLTSIVYPQDTGLTESFVYDSDGRRIIRKLGTAAMPGSVYDDSLVYDWRGKVTKAFLRASSRVVENWYDGLGRVVASSWQSTISGDLNVDQFRTDPYGNIAWSRKRDGFGNAPEYENHYDPYGRITLVQLAPTSPNPSTWSHEWREYDAAGNVSFAAEVRFGPGQMEPTTEVHRRTTRYYYSADKRLVYSQRFARDPIDMGGDSDDLFEEIRYDALGRRILVRTQHAPFGAVGKSDAMTRFVWDGDQLLGELRASGDQLEATFGTGRQYGRVTYLHGGEIDKPLGVYRNDFSNAVGPTLIVPYVNWRGQHERGTFVGGAPECTGSHSDCIHVEWPAPKMRTYLDGQAPGEGDWVGSLLQDQLDESGLLYRRNRYYDPNTGQFTQEDPIGIAGGLNLYGFADGDPLTYSDPFGLCPEDVGGDGETERFDDCPEGSSGWYAHRLATGEGNELLNIAGGLFATLWEFANYDYCADTGECVSAVMPAVGSRGIITGYRRHGLQQAISRDGVGVAPSAILDAVRNPTRVIQQAEGKLKYVGQNATVILNKAGEVVTTWARNHLGWRIKP